jgi:hypothetical protein
MFPNSPFLENLNPPRPSHFQRISMFCGVQQAESRKYPTLGKMGTPMFPPFQDGEVSSKLYTPNRLF